MKKTLLYFAVGVLSSGVCASLQSAAGSNEERSLNTAAASIDKESTQPQGKKEVVVRLENEFNVTEAQIDALRSQNLGFGEISIVYSLAEKMPGGITDANVQSILSMRSGDPTTGWGQVARQLGEKLGPVVRDVNEIAGHSRPDAERVGRADRGDRPERPQRPEKPEKPEKPGKR